VDTLPFGGVDSSGYGSYHGKYTYDTFSHKKSGLIRDFGFVGEKLGDFRYPPYSASTISTARMLMRYTKIPSIPSCIKYMMCVGFGVVLVIVTKAIAKSFEYDLPAWI
jgi:hypothetical protein